jgi:predicted nucleic acid-binding protein
VAFLIDTCIWIDVERGMLSVADVAAVTGQDPVYLSPVTIAELTFGAELASDPLIRERRRAALRRLRRKPLLAIDGETGEVFGQMVASLKSYGRSHRHRVQDLWLASQCIQHGFRLLTRNKADFDDIPGLELVLISATE